jgi:hypothetical protein
MKRYWVIAPYNSTIPEVFDKVWEYDFTNGTIAVGWRELRNTSHLGEKSELESRYRKVYGDSVSKSTCTRDVNALWRFYHEVSPGDMVIARRGTKRIIGVGTVTGSPFYDENRGIERVAHLIEDYYSNFISVQWEEREIEFDRIVFSFYTIYEISEEKYRSLVGKDSEEDAKRSAEFALEKHLEDFIVKNFDNIFNGQLELYRDEGSVGQQYPVIDSQGKEIGYIDILAREPSTNSYIIIELKKGRESDRVVGQALRYMGWVAENLCHEGEKVKGLIICKEMDERLVYALRMVQDIIKVKLYRVDFQLVDSN